MSHSKKRSDLATSCIDDAVAGLDQSIALEQYEFLTKARDRGLLKNTAHMTVFIPENEYICNTSEDFELLWNRHTAKGRINVTGMEQQIFTHANLTYGIYKENDADQIPQDKIAGVEFTFINVKSPQFGKYTFHGIHGLLPDLRPNVEGFKVRYLGLESVDVKFDLVHLSPALSDRNLTILTTISDTIFTLLAPPHQTPWIDADVPTEFVIPNVSSPQKAIVWFSVFDNLANLRLITTSLAWEIDILPNIYSVYNPIITDIHPRKGQADDIVFICGANFSSQTARIFFGDSIANVYSISDNLIKCFVPPQNTDSDQLDVDITVFNANVYVTFKHFTYISNP